MKSAWIEVDTKSLLLLFSNPAPDAGTDGGGGQSFGGQAWPDERPLIARRWRSVGRAHVRFRGETRPEIANRHVSRGRLVSENAVIRARIAGSVAAFLLMD